MNALVDRSMSIGVIKGLTFQCLLLLVVSTDAFGVDPHRRISQYGHTAWRMQDGVFNSTPNVIAQTADGYLWIGTQSGLVRFDGSRFVAGTTATGQALPDVRITSLRSARDGSLWIGTPYGLSRLKNGELTSYSTTAGISTIIEDHAGNIWVTRYRVTDGQGPLCEAIEAALKCYGKDDGVPVTYGVGLAEDSLGNLWIGSYELVRWRPGAVETFFEEELKHLKGSPGIVDIVGGTGGVVWAALEGAGPKLGVRQYLNGNWTSFVVPGFDGSRVSAQSLFIDRDGALWIGTDSDGVYRIYDQKVDHFRSVNGLSGDSVISFFQDREGNLWLVTDGGVDLLRDTPMMTWSTQEGLSTTSARSVLGAVDGSLWIGGKGSLDNFRNGEFTSLKTNQGLPGDTVHSIFEDHAGRLWLGVDEKLLTYEKGKFTEIQTLDGKPLALGGQILGLAEDPDQNIWAMAYTIPRHLYRIRDQKVREEIAVGDIQYAAWLTSDKEGGIWLGSYSDNKIAHYKDKQLQVISLSLEGKSPIVHYLLAESANSILVATSTGLFRWKDGVSKHLGLENGLPCSLIFSLIKDDYNAFWMYTNCGVLRLAPEEVERWWNNPSSQVAFTTYGSAEGARPGSSSGQPRVTKTGDGRLWFSNGITVQRIDPNHLYKNDVQPLVRIEGVVADRKSYSSDKDLQFPPLTGDVEIDYTALSFSVPQKVRFRYKLEGHDTNWQDPGTRRLAFYSDLSPGTYRFHVIASNNDDVWNETGATLSFTIPPAWYQTAWFRIAVPASVLLLLFLIYRLRVRQIAKNINSRFDVRLEERTRMARELHDTFLQTIQGCTLVADDALETATDLPKMRHAMERLSKWLNQATQEGRAALNSLRTSTIATNDLAEAFRRATQNGVVPSSMQVDFSVQGESKDMHPIVRDEIYRIGFEAIHNSIIHSHAKRLKVQLTYAHDLTLRVKDDGVGIDPTTLNGGKDGHFGLQGMRERAVRVGGKLAIVSSATLGTDITLTIPGLIVFRKSSPEKLD